MKRRKLVTVSAITAAILILIFAVPFAINELYKHGAGYTTVWNGADVLSFYGTILGTISTILALVITIAFTHKQIRRDSYLKSENEKWARIESIFANALDEINPMRPLISVMDTGHTDPSAAIRTIQKYNISCETATDQLNAHLNIADFPKVKCLVEGITKCSKQITPIFQEEIVLYTKIRNIANKSLAERILAMEKQNPN